MPFILVPTCHLKELHVSIKFYQYSLIFFCFLAPVSISLLLSRTSFQTGGAFMSALFCGVIMAYFARVRPFVYENGNVLSVLSFGSLLTSYTAAAFKKLNHDLGVERGSHDLNNAESVNNVIFFIWLLPYLYGAADALGVVTLVSRGLFVSGRRCARLRIPPLIRQKLNNDYQRAIDLKAISRSQTGRADRVIVRILYGSIPPRTPMLTCHSSLCRPAPPAAIDDSSHTNWKCLVSNVVVFAHLFLLALHHAPLFLCTRIF